MAGQLLSELPAFVWADAWRTIESAGKTPTVNDSKRIPWGPWGQQLLFMFPFALSFQAAIPSYLSKSDKHQSNTNTTTRTLSLLFRQGALWQGGSLFHLNPRTKIEWQRSHCLLLMFVGFKFKTFWCMERLLPPIRKSSNDTTMLSGLCKWRKWSPKKGQRISMKPKNKSIDWALQAIRTS